MPVYGEIKPSPQEVFANRALTCLRQIRGSVFTKTKVEPHVAIRDAESVGALAGAYIVDPIGKSEDQEKPELLAALEGLEANYRTHKPYTQLSEWAVIRVKDFVPSYLDAYRLLSRNPDPVHHDRLWRSLMGSNNEKLMPDLDMFNDRLGIVSPLSSDYLFASLLQHFIEQHTELPCFKIKPLILGPALEFDPNLGIGQRDELFDGGVDEIAVWTNLDISKATRRASLRAVELIYPGKLKYGFIPE